MLTPEQRTRVRAVFNFFPNYDDDGLYRHTKERAIDCTALELHVVAALWDWRNGWEALRAIVEHPRCDAATALQIFWLGRPEAYLDDWMMSCDAEEYDVEHRDLLLHIQERYAQGAFGKSTIAYDPTSEFKACKHGRILACMREKVDGASPAAAIEQIRHIR